jgi:hypothetical protein
MTPTADSIAGGVPRFGPCRSHWLDLLTRRVRLVAEEQLDRRGLRALKSLERRGWVECIRVRSRRLPDLTRPLWSWWPGLRNPHFGRLAYYARNRWEGRSRTLRAYIATEQAADLLGGRGGPLRNPLQAAHDLALATVYQTMLREAPGLARGWTGEDALALEARPGRGERLPDALIRTPSGHPVVAVEVIGESYGVERITAFAAACEARALPFMLW